MNFATGPHYRGAAAPIGSVPCTLFAERKSRARIYGPHEQTETNPAQPRERLENSGERHLRRPTDCLGKPVRGGLGADERRNAHGRKSRRVIRAAPRG